MKSNACSPSLPADNRGAALIIALLIVAAVSGLAIGFSADFQLSSARAENRWHGAQAREYLYGGEDFGIFALVNDDDTNVDSYTEGEAWAQGLPETPIEGGSILGSIEDAQGRFNLNSLAGRGNDDNNNRNRNPRGQTNTLTPAQRRFIRLLQCFEDIPMDSTAARIITNSVIDWLDADSNETAGEGAEASAYQEMDPPYRPANQLMKSASELRMVRGITPELYALLEPLVIALPKTDTNINVNTALPTLLRTFNTAESLDPLTELDAQTMIEERGEKGYQSLSEFQQGTVPQQFAGMETEGLSVNSNYFIIHVSAEIGRQRRNLNSLVERAAGDDASVKVIQRSDNQF